MSTVMHTHFCKETCEQTLFTPASCKVILTHARYIAQTFFEMRWIESVLGLKSALGAEAGPALRVCASSRPPLLLEPKRLGRTRKTIQQGAEVLPLLSLITSSQPPWSHGNLIAMVTHHSNPIAMLKSSRNANTQFTFLTAPVNEGMGAQSCSAVTVHSWRSQCVCGETSGSSVFFRWSKNQPCRGYFRLLNNHGRNED